MFRKLWALLDTGQRWHALWLALVSFVAGVSSAIMVTSILPFLSVLADPSVVEREGILSILFQMGGFESASEFAIALGMISVCIIITGNAIIILRVFSIVRFAANCSHQFAVRVLSAHLQTPYLRFASEHTSEVSAQVLSETQMAVDRGLKPAAEIFSACLALCFLVIVLLTIEPIISIILFAVVSSIYAAITFITRKRIRWLGQRRKEANSRRFRAATESIAGIREFKLASRETHQLNRFIKPSQTMVDSIAQIATLGQIPQHAIMAAAFSSVILICLMLIGAAGDSEMISVSGIVPTLGFLAFAGQRILSELSRLFMNGAQLISAGPSIDVVFDAILKPKDLHPLPDTPPAPMGLKSKIELRGISFEYPNSNGAGLKDIRFHVEAGERIGIVGSTGSGKSTLANILLGLYTPSSGEVLVDDTPITLKNVRPWQRTIGYVPQEIFLLDASVKQNVAFGVPEFEIDSTKVEEACKIASIDQFIRDDLPKGYDTLIGERGARLSGGQRQRLGIARALYDDVDVILFDEATSALDNATESMVMELLNDMPARKTMLMIAHRLSSLRNCDRILVLQNGRVAAFDTWDRLEENSKAFVAISKTMARA